MKKIILINTHFVEEKVTSKTYAIIANEEFSIYESLTTKQLNELEEKQHNIKKLIILEYISYLII